MSYLCVGKKHTTKTFIVTYHCLQPPVFRICFVFIIVFPHSSRTRLKLHGRFRVSLVLLFGAGTACTVNEWWFDELSWAELNWCRRSHRDLPEFKNAAVIFGLARWVACCRGGNNDRHPFLSAVLYWHHTSIKGCSTKQSGIWFWSEGSVVNKFEPKHPSRVA